MYMEDGSLFEMESDLKKPNILIIRTNYIIIHKFNIIL